jgi:hypothetical protein
MVLYIYTSCSSSGSFKNKRQIWKMVYFFGLRIYLGNETLKHADALINGKVF